MNTGERFEQLCEAYQQRFGELPRYGLGENARRGAQLLELALERGLPLTLEEVYGPEVAEGRAVAAPQETKEDVGAE